jgi:hypothetical protein
MTRHFDPARRSEVINKDPSKFDTTNLVLLLELALAPWRGRDQRLIQWLGLAAVLFIA